MFSFFDHTADLGIRVEADSLDQLFAEAARGLTAAIVEDPATIRPHVSDEIAIVGDDRVYLLFDWLNELLFRFEARRMLYSHFDVKVGDTGLTATVAGEPLDPARHPLGHEVKAITYHGLSVAQDNGRWIAEIIVDI